MRYSSIFMDLITLIATILDEQAERIDQQDKEIADLKEKTLRLERIEFGTKFNCSTCKIKGAIFCQIHQS